MIRLRTSLLLLGSCVPYAAHAHDWYGTPGSLVSVSVEVEGRETPLYAATDGSGRYYLEARQGARYAIRLANRGGERLGVAVTVDGLNVISGERVAPRRRPASTWTERRPEPEPGRMYILDPWDTTVVRGWRTSLQDVQRFTFVDERASYAARSGKANSKMGWIEVAAYRERRPWVRYPLQKRPDWVGGQPPEEPRADGRSDGAGAEAPPPATAPAAPSGARDRDQAPAARSGEKQEGLRGLGYTEGRSESYPGTGWGPRADDPAVVVAFDPQPYPAERITLRYEYARALQALGIPVGPRPGRDRLAERDRAQAGFAKPPER